MNNIAKANTTKENMIFSKDMFLHYYEKYKNEDKLIIKKYGDYTIIKYNKSSLNIEEEPMLGFFRSIILKKDKIVCFSPQKCLNFNCFIEEHDIENCNISEIIEGTMINLFYDKENNFESYPELKHWMICTRSNVGASCRFNLDYKDTFRDMFIEAVERAKLYDTNLNKNLCYSFVLQHPKNQTVVSCNSPKITLTNVYRINNNNIFEVTDSIHLDNVSKPVNIELTKPYETIDSVYTIRDWDSLTEICAGDSISQSMPGFMIKNKDGSRTKLCNIAYKTAKSLHGNSQKKQYQYWNLDRKIN